MTTQTQQLQSSAPTVAGRDEGEMFPFWKGRVALYFILKAIGMREGDEVILPAFTCVVVPSAVVYLGAKPVYVDIDPATLNIDPRRVAEKISTRTKAIIAQHTFGLPAPMDELRSNSIRLIEDSAHAYGATYHGHPVGSLGDAAFFSTQWSKPFTTGLGGIAVASDAAIRARLKELYVSVSVPALLPTLKLRTEYCVHRLFYRPQLFWIARGSYHVAQKLGLGVGSSSAEELEIQKPRNYEQRMSAFQRRLLEKKLESSEAAIAHRRKLSRFYEMELRKAGFFTPRVEADVDPVFLRFPALVADKEKTLREARRQRLEIGDWFVSPVHPNMTGWEKVGYMAGSCPIAEGICRHIINLPTHPGVSEAEAVRVMEFVRKQKPWLKP
jgi:dTDP-4-amino-4,6-dideoxygalactose transaminase